MRQKRTPSWPGMSHGPPSTARAPSTSPRPTRIVARMPLRNVSEPASPKPHMRVFSTVLRACSSAPARSPRAWRAWLRHIPTPLAPNSEPLRCASARSASSWASPSSRSAQISVIIGAIGTVPPW